MPDFPIKMSSRHLGVQLESHRVARAGGLGDINSWKMNI